MKEEYMSIKPAPGTCCPEMEYRFLSIHILGNGAMWEIMRCTGCDHLKKRFIGWFYKLEEGVSQCKPQNTGNPGKTEVKP